VPQAGFPVTHYPGLAKIMAAGFPDVRDPFLGQNPVQPAVAGGYLAPWAVELGHRIRKGFFRTTISTTLLTGLFFIGYFWVQRHPAYSPIMMPQTALDLRIPFQAPALLAYVSVWIYIGFGPGLQRTVRDFAVYGLWLCGLCICGLAIFYFWPTQVPRSMIAATDFPGFVLLHRIDESSNACPSMHVAVAIFTVVRVDEVLRSMRVPLQLRLINAAWFAAIVYSTLAIKQHLLVDVAAGACLGLVFALMSLRWRPGLGGEPSFAALALRPYPQKPTGETWNR
jgi:membrane-associated phospholipid phosphatase